MILPNITQVINIFANYSTILIIYTRGRFLLIGHRSPGTVLQPASYLRKLHTDFMPPSARRGNQQRLIHNRTLCPQTRSKLLQTLRTIEATVHQRRLISPLLTKSAENLCVTQLIKSCCNACSSAVKKGPLLLERPFKCLGIL